MFTVGNITLDELELEYEENTQRKNESSVTYLVKLLFAKVYPYNVYNFKLRTVSENAPGEHIIVENGKLFWEILSKFSAIGSLVSLVHFQSVRSWKKFFKNLFLTLIYLNTVTMSSEKKYL